MAKYGRYKNYSITSGRGPKVEPKRTEAERLAIKERKRKLDFIEDREFVKSLGLYDSI